MAATKLAAPHGGGELEPLLPEGAELEAEIMLVEIKFLGAAAGDVQNMD